MLIENAGTMKTSSKERLISRSLHAANFMPAMISNDKKAGNYANGNNPGDHPAPPVAERFQSGSRSLLT
jgi:hypothetical protein